MNTPASQRALQLARTPPPFGLLTEAFVACFDELLLNLIELATRANFHRLDSIRPLIEVLDRARSDSVRQLNGLPGLIPIIDLLEFERLLRDSLIIEELSAYNTFLQAPSELVSDSEKGEKGEKVVESFKDAAKKLKEKVPQKLPWPFEKVPVEDIFDALMETIDEILRTLFPVPKQEPQ